MADLLSYALTTLADVKESLGIDSGDTNNDNLLIRYINAATEAIEKYCNRRFASTSYTEKYDGNGTCYLVLKHYPVTALTKIEYLTSDYASDKWEEVDANFCSYQSDGRVYYSGGFSKGFNNWRITYTAGYSTIPADVAEACVQLVVWQYKQGKSKGIKSERLGEYSVEWFGQSTTSVIKELGLDDILDSYRTPTI